MNNAPAIRRWRTGAVLLAAALTLGACSTLDPETREQLEVSQEQLSDLGGPTDALADATPQQRECIDAGVRREDLDLEVAVADASLDGVDARVALANIAIECVGDLSTLPSYRSQFTTAIAASWGPASDIDEEEGRCLLSWILEHADDPGSALMGNGSEAETAMFVEGMAECFDQASQDALSGAEGTGPAAYGDDPARDALYDDCSAGDDPACDLLYEKSAIGSEYSDLGFDCAGRGTGESYCTPGFDVGDDELLTDNAPALATLRSSCESGDMTSCDLLVLFAPLGSGLEQFAFTCGGRIAVGAIPDCRTRFPDGG